MTIEQLKDKILKFTPTFVVINEILTGLYMSIATSISYVLTELEALPNADWTGKGLIKNSEENGIINTKRSEANLQTDLENRFIINSKRGTEAGILDDVSKLLNINSSVDLSITFYTFGSSGIIVGFTKLSDITAIVGSNKLIVIEYIPKLLDELGTPILDEDGIMIGEDNLGIINKYRDEIEELIPIDTNLILVD